MKINNNCVGCGQCLPICKYDAILVFGKSEINNKCVNCMVCIAYCPVKAIDAIDSISEKCESCNHGVMVTK